MVGHGVVQYNNACRSHGFNFHACLGVRTSKGVALAAQLGLACALHELFVGVDFGATPIADV
jgi:hypothetical protein